MERRTPKKVVVSKAAVKKSGARATKASAKLEGREVPVGHKRSVAVRAYIAKQQPPKRLMPPTPGYGATHFPGSSAVSLRWKWSSRP